MRFLDALIVAVVEAILRGVMAVGTVLAYVQFLTLSFLLAMVGTTLLAVFLVAIRGMAGGA